MTMGRTIGIPGKRSVEQPRDVICLLIEFISFFDSAFEQYPCLFRRPDAFFLFFCGQGFGCPSITGWNILLASSTPPGELRLGYYVSKFSGYAVNQPVKLHSFGFFGIINNYGRNAVFFKFRQIGHLPIDSAMSPANTEYHRIGCSFFSSSVNLTGGGSIAFFSSSS